MAASLELVSRAGRECESSQPWPDDSHTRHSEQSRVFYFASGQADPLAGRVFIGSADWMHRTLSSRVEVVAPVTSRSARERLWEVLEVCVRDRRQFAACTAER